MATPVIDNLILPVNRCLVLADEDSKTTGVIFRKSAQGFFRLEQGQALIDEQQSPAVPYDHVLFIKEGAVEVEINGVEYLCMHQSNIVGVIP